METRSTLLLMIFVSYGIQPVVSGPMGNLALAKPSRASDVYRSGSKATLANDGDILGKDEHYASHGNVEDPFWRVDLLDFYLVLTVEVVCRIDGYFERIGVMEVRVGNSLENEGNSNPLCGEPKDLSNLPGHTYRCELYGRYVNVKKSAIPRLEILVVQEVLVNQEPTTNVAFGKTTSHSSRFKVASGSEYAVDGTISKFNSQSGAGYFPHWIMIDLAETMPIVKLFFFHSFKSDRLTKMIITLGDSSADHGKNNPRLGDVHDLSYEYRQQKITSLYCNPRVLGRYLTVESLRTEQMALEEIEMYSESLPSIAERTNGLGSYSVTLYNGQQAVLPCHGDGYPPPRVAWVSDGVVLQNRSSDQDTNLVIVANQTKGTTAKYECWANNAHGKDLYVVTATFAGRYDMCTKPKEIKDPTRNRFSKRDATKEIQHDKKSFDSSEMYSFSNPLSRLNMKLTTTCPPVSSCGTDAPGWLPDGHPQPEDGVVRRKVCFHYNGDCCYKSLYIDVINCPGMFVYGLKNTVFGFSARYCFEDDVTNEGYLPFRFSSSFFTPVGGTDTALVNHVIATEHGIEDSGQCLIVCMMTKCRSLNYDKTEKICEVNDVTKDDYPRDLSAKAGFQYYHPMKHPVLVKKYN